jgi:integrase
MKMKLPPYVQAFCDRHGHPRYYFRRAGFPRIPLPGLPYSPAFMAAHAEALTSGLSRANVGTSRITPGTMNALVIAYFNSPPFHQLSKTTQTTYRGILEAFITKHGEKRVATLERQHIAHMMNLRAATPSAANNLLRMLRLVLKFAVHNGWRRSDPTIGLKPLRVRTSGFHAWTEADIRQFEETHPVGTRARLAFDLLVYTAQRRSDVISMGRQHVKNGILAIRQQKTGAAVEIPVLPDLRASLDSMPNEHLTFLITAEGKPFTAAGFGNWFREVCNIARLPKHCSAHGLRKAAARRLAEAGCTVHEIMSITGHKTLREVTRYTETVDRRAMAQGAMEKLRKRTSSVKPG